MDAATQEAVDWVLKIAGAAIAILPLVFTVALIKGAKGIVGTVAGRMQGSRAAKGITGFGERVGENVSGRRRIKAMDPKRKGVWGSFLGAGYRMSARSHAVHAGIKGEAEKAERDYISNLAESDEKFRKQMAGGLPNLEKLTQGLLGAADPAALQRALAGARFTIDKAEADEVKAAHASIDLLGEKGLNDVLADNNQSNAMKAAALERLVKVGSMDSIEKAINTVGKSGESNVMTRSLANALRDDGPGFLKAADIDNIGRGQMGATYTDAQGNTKQVASSLEQMVGENLAAGVLSPEKMVASSGNELEYASKVAGQVAATTGVMDAVNNLQDAATKVNSNPTLSGKVKNNRSQIDSLEAHGTI